MLFSFKGPSNQTTHENVYLAGSLVATIDHAWPSNAVTATKYQHTDALGSPVAISDASGTIIERTNYDPYGGPIGKAVNGMGYTGHVMDGATGLTYMQQRYYDPAVGRFLSVDPVTASLTTGEGFNRYGYADNSPYRFIDPDGRYSCETEVCPYIRAYVAAMRESMSNLRSPGDQRRIDRLLRYIGTEGSAGPLYKSGQLKGDKLANTDQAGTTTIDLGKASNDNEGAMAIGHEANHDLDAKVRGRITETSAEVRDTETKSYRVGATIGKGLGISISRAERRRAVDASVKNWESRQARRKVGK